MAKQSVREERNYANKTSLCHAGEVGFHISQRFTVKKAGFQFQSFRDVTSNSQSCAKGKILLPLHTTSILMYKNEQVASMCTGHIAHMIIW